MGEDVDYIGVLRWCAFWKIGILGSPALLIIDYACPSEIHITVLDADKTSWLKERQCVNGMVDYGSYILFQGFDLLLDLEVVGDSLLILDDILVPFCFQLLLFCAVEFQRFSKMSVSWLILPFSRRGTATVL